MDSQEQAAREICRRLREAGHHAVLAGGCVRDWLLGIPPKDFDVATSALPAEVRACFPGGFDVGAAFGVTMVRHGGHLFEVATFRSDGAYSDGRRPDSVAFTTPEADALRRDFTINALFLDPASDEVLDYVGGRRDLEAGVVRAVGDPAARFAEDHLRLLRAVRFAARLGYIIEARTFAAMKACAPLAAKTSAERIRDELNKMLTEGAARRAFEHLDEAGLLEVVLPEISAMKGVEQPAAFHPEGDVFQHTLLLLEHLEAGAPLAVAWGALLHDVGKPPTQTFEDRIRFNQHEKVGAHMARRICMRLRFPNAFTERVVWLVGQHMRLAAAPAMRESKRRRFVREEGFGDLLAVCRLDCLASLGDTSTVDAIADYRSRLSPEEVRPAPLLNGHDLRAMGYEPGPLFKEILSAVEDAQLEGELENADAARAWVRRQWPPPV